MSLRRQSTTSSTTTHQSISCFIRKKSIWTSKKDFTKPEMGNSDTSTGKTRTPTLLSFKKLRHPTSKITNSKVIFIIIFIREKHNQIIRKKAL
jgi:hypothetical protein